MTITFEADYITIDSDEHGWELIVDDTDGMRHQIRVHGCIEEFLAAARRIEEWLDEGRREAALYNPEGGR